REQGVFADAAKTIDPTKKPIEVFKEIQKDHPTEESLIPDTRKNLEAIRQFLIDHKIVTLSSDVRARVEETPQFDRATSFASMDTPGPFESKATEAYYYVTPVERDQNTLRSSVTSPRHALLRRKLLLRTQACSTGGDSRHVRSGLSLLLPGQVGNPEAAGRLPEARGRGVFVAKISR